MMNVTVTNTDLLTAHDKGSVIVVTGTGDDGSRVTFAGDARIMNGFIEAVIMGDGEATADVEPWQILAVVYPADEGDDQE